jgi:RNA polymerase sigma-70 factor (ECF subfamily)
MAYNGAMPLHLENIHLEKMFREYAPRVLDYARHRGATLAEAEDIVSEVFIVLTRRLDDAPDEILPWLYGVARKVLGNQVRSKRRRVALTRRIEQEVSWLHPDSPDALFAGSSDAVIGRALSMLPDRDREVLILVAWDDLSYRQAAESLGCTSAAFAQMLRRARQRMLHNIDQLRTHDMSELAMGESRE